MALKSNGFRAAAFCGLLLALLALTAGQPAATDASTAQRFEKRCGWFINPTPANVWFDDADGEWTIGVQGGYQIEEDWPWPEFKPRQWVVTNAGDHGYGCACMEMKVDRETRHVLAIRSAQARPLSACRRDKKLKEPK
jgi:hypothetical protein